MGDACCCQDESLQIFQVLKQSRQCGSWIFEFALPNCEHMPTVVSQLFHDLSISSDIGFQFFCPEIDTSLGQDCVLAVSMAVPETTMYKYTGLQSRQ